MPLNNAWFANYLNRTREQRRWSQQQVADAGGPYRQALAAIENRTETVLRSDTLRLVERAYGWPDLYADALAELGEYAEDPDRALPDSLRGGERDQAAMASSYGGHASESTISKTFSGLYKRPSSTDDGRRFVYVGFDVASGDPVFLEGPALTTVAFENLHPMILARHGVTTIDVNATGAEALKQVREYCHGQMSGVAQSPMKCYSVGLDEFGADQAIVLEPLSEISSLSEAKRLAEELLAIRRHVETPAVRAAFTYLAIAAFGEDQLTTLTQLKRRSVDPFSATEFGQRFGAFWKDFYDPAKAGPDLAQPDPKAYDLLAGVLAARDATMEVQIGRHQGQRYPRYALPEVVSAESLTCDAQGPALIFYDGAVIPELPAIQSIMHATEALTFYRVESTAPLPVHNASDGDGAAVFRRQFSPRLGKVPYYRIGVSSADDRDVVEQHRVGSVSTLTNFVSGNGGGQAIYCDAGRARRVWIPQR